MALMIDSTDVRKMNYSLVRKVLWEGGQHTKQTMAKDTGLSIATCNTLLNELAASGEIVSEKCQLNGVGRSTMVYTLNEEYENILCIYFDLLSDNVRMISSNVLTMLKTTVYTKSIETEVMDVSMIQSEIEKCIALYPNISSIMVGVNGIVDDGIIKMSDIPEMDDVNIKEAIKKVAGNRPFHVSYGLQYGAFGAYTSKGYKSGIVTLFFCVRDVIPGSASVANGHILNGRNGFAGMTGYIGFEKDTDINELTKQIAAGDLTMIYRSLMAIITVLNPDEIVFAGNVITQDNLDEIISVIERHIPLRFIPKFSFAPNYGDDYYLEGMYQKSKELKTNILNL